MNYAMHYDRLIERARNRNIVGYSEKHHILPVCMGGDNSARNLVRLTAEEHYVAHQFLIKMYPSNMALVKAMALLSTGNPNRRNKLYGWLRRKMAAAMTGRLVSEDTRRKIGLHSRGKHYSLGLIRSAETRARISAAKRGKTTSLLGVPKSEKHKLAMRKPKTAGHIQKLRDIGLLPENRAATLIRFKGVPKSEGQKRKQSIAMKGRPSPRKGATMSASSKEKLSFTQKARLGLLWMRREGLVT
jgi:NUMOD3 motif